MKNYLCLFLIAVSAFAMGCAKPTYLSNPNETKNEKADAAKTCFSNTDACVTILWEKQPTEDEYGSFVFTISDRAGLLVDVDTKAPMVSLGMPSMTHPAFDVKVEKLGTGLYRATDVFFNMKGDWEIYFVATSTQASYAIKR